MSVIDQLKCDIFGHKWEYIGLNKLNPSVADIECVRCDASDSRWILPNDILGYDQEAVLEEHHSYHAGDEQ